MTERDRHHEFGNPPEIPPVTPTDEVGSEGGSPGDVETGVDRAPATGSEATELVERHRPVTVERDLNKPGTGRRDP